MMRTTALVLSLLAIVCCQTIWAMPNNCANGDTCIDIRECDFFGPHHNQPANWTAEQKEAFENRICKEEQSSGGSNVYKVCCQKSRITRSLNSRTHLLDLDRCGVYTLDRIAHGDNAKLYEYPWMALLGVRGNWICGGTLIHKRFVLTAAHCLQENQIDTVRLGEYDLNLPKDCDTDMICADPPQDIPVERAIEHPKYHHIKKLYDIALLRLAHEATFNDNVMPICLPATAELKKVHSPYFVAGWGATENSTASNILQVAKMKEVMSDTCQMEIEKIDSFKKLYSTQMCAIGEKHLSDNCYGDSGGPLKAVAWNSRMVQYGVVSYGISSCGIMAAPGVYTRVESFIDWILDNLEG